MLIITIQIDPADIDIQGTKEQIAMDLEKYGVVHRVSVKFVSSTEQMRIPEFKH